MKYILGFCLLFVTLVANADMSARVILKPGKRAIISSEIGARVIRLPFKEGDSFKAKDTLVGLECVFYQAQRDKISAEHAATIQKFDNVKKLEKSRSVGELDVTLAQSEVIKSDAEMQMAELNVRRCTIQAPWSGRVVKRMANEFESVDPHKELMEIVSDSGLEAEMIIPSNWVTRVRPGSHVTLKIDETGGTYTARVIALGASVDPVSQTMPVRLALEGGLGLLRPGMTGSAAIQDAGGSVGDVGKKRGQ
jgi:RND family efflux transporter MFP subunit